LPEGAKVFCCLCLKTFDTIEEFEAHKKECKEKFAKKWSER
jgi:hypothetical protein